MLGGACTYISLSASYFTDVHIVAVVGEDFDPADEELLRSRNIGLEGLERVPGKTFFWAGVYSQDMNDRTTLQTDLNVFAGFDPKVPKKYQDLPYLLLGNIQPALQRSVQQQMAGLKFAGGFIGHLAQCGFDPKDPRIDPKHLHRAVIYGSVMGSFCCEQFGVERFRTLSRADIDGRFEEFRRATEF